MSSAKENAQDGQVFNFDTANSVEQSQEAVIDQLMDTPSKKKLKAALIPWQLK